MQELAWASASLIKNTNCCGVVVVHRGKPVLARGALGSPVVQDGPAKATLDAISKVSECLQTPHRSHVANSMYPPDVGQAL